MVIKWPMYEKDPKHQMEARLLVCLSSKDFLVEAQQRKEEPTGPGFLFYS